MSFRFYRCICIKKNSKYYYNFAATILVRRWSVGVLIRGEKKGEKRNRNSQVLNISTGKIRYVPQVFFIKLPECEIMAFPFRPLHERSLDGEWTWPWFNLFNQRSLLADPLYQCVYLSSCPLPPAPASRPLPPACCCCRQHWGWIEKSPIPSFLHSSRSKLVHFMASIYQRPVQ